MATKNNRRSVMTEKLLTDAFTAIMQEKAFSQITIKELCERADINRTTFYLHYQNLNDLFSRMEQEALSRISEYIKTIRSKANTVKSISLLLEYAKENSDTFKVLLFNTDGRVPRSEFSQHLFEIINKSSVIGATEMQQFYTKSFVTTGCFGLINAWFENDFNPGSEELADLIYKICSGAYTAID